MGLLGDDLRKDLRAAVEDLDEKCAKQVLFGLVNEFAARPTIRSSRFIELVFDGRSYAKILKEKSAEVSGHLKFSAIGGKAGQ